MASVPHPVPSRLSHLTAELYGREDDTLVAWRQTCVQATDALRPPYAGERLSKALALAQGGAVTLEKGGCALVKSGSVHYEVQADGRCNCTDYAQRGGPCKHVLAVLIHTQTLALLEPDPGPWEPEPPAPSTPPGYATVADLQRAHPTSATWNVHEAPTSACFKWRVGSAELMYTFRGVTDAEVLDRIREHLPLLQDILEVCELRAAERAAARAAVLAPAQQAPASAPTPPALTPQTLQALQALLTAPPAASNGATANGHATGHTPAQPPRCPAHGDMRESTQKTGTWFCPQKLADGTYCKTKA